MADQKDITDGLSAEQLEELTQLVNEPSDKDVISFEEFMENMIKWRKDNPHK